MMLIPGVEPGLEDTRYCNPLVITTRPYNQEHGKCPKIYKHVTGRVMKQESIR